MTMDDESGVKTGAQAQDGGDAGNGQGEIVLDRFIPPSLEPAFEEAIAAESRGPEAAIAAYEKAWDSCPGHPEVVDALLKLFEQTGKWLAMAEFIKKQVPKVEDEAYRIYALMTLAQIYDTRLKQDVMAVNTYQSVLKIREGYLPAIDAASAKYEQMERWPDLVKLLKVKGAHVRSSSEKVEVFLRVAQLFLQRFSNQAEAIKAFEEVIAADPAHDQAIEFLKDMYEKRRDWEKLANIMELSANLLPEGPDRIDAYIKIAQLTTERLKRPEDCMKRWEAVIALDPENREAIANLSGLYERTKEWRKLADTLEKQIEAATDPNERAALLQKIGQVYGDKIEDDARAVAAWKALLEIQPDDRRAQEQLKKRYLAMAAWDELEQFYAAAEKWDEFIRILEREAGNPAADNKIKISLQFKIAELWSTRKTRPDRAAKCYEAILELDPNNLEAAEAFIPLLEDGKEPARLADVLQVRLSHIEDDGEKIALMKRIAQIAEDQIGDMNRAFEGYLSAFRLMPESEDAQDDLERAAGKAGQFEKVVETYKALLERDSENVGLQLRVARVLDEELGRSEEALAYYDAIIGADPKNVRAVGALEKIYAQMGRFEELLAIYTRRLEMAEDDEERKEILYNQALLWEEEVHDRNKAIEVLLQIVALAGDESRALSSLDRLYTAEERWPELADVLERALAQGIMAQEEELGLKFRLGEVSDTRLGDKAKALECYREILAIDPDYALAESALERLLQDEGQQEEAARILVPSYEKRGDWEKLIAALEIIVKRSADAIERYDNLLRIGELFAVQLGTPERAFVAYSRAFRANPTDARALEKLEEITLLLDSWNDFVALLVEGAVSADDGEVVKSLWLRAARVYVTQIGDIEEAIVAYNKALEADPANMEAIDALENVYTRTERWDALIKVLKTKVDITFQTDAKEAIYRQMAMIYEEMLDKPENAVACMQEILSFDPVNLAALTALDKLLERLERWTDLADNLQQQLSIGDDLETITALKLRLAGLREARLDEIGGAIEIFREILEVDGSNEEAVAALERIIENPDYRADIANILEPIYKALGNSEKLIGVYEIMVEREEAGPRKVELLHQIANLYETAGDDPEGAFKTLGRALAADPSDQNTQEQLQRLARTLSLYEALAALYEKTVGGLEDPVLAADYHLKLAETYETQLQNMESAITHYRAVLEVDPMHLDAATALERAYQITENYAELAGIYLRKVEMVALPDEQKELLFKASQIYEEILDNAEKAIEVYKRVLEIDGDDLGAIGHLETLYLKLSRWDDLQGVYNRKVDLVHTVEEKRDVLYVLGAMYEQEVHDTAKAIETYQRILEFEPEDVQAIQRLDILFTETQEWHDLKSILEREVELSGDPEEAISFKFRIGELYVKHLDDVTRAVECFKEIVLTSPDHQPSIRALEQLLESGSAPMLVAEVLEPLYKDLGEWRKFIGVLEVKTKAAEEPWRRVELLHEIAGILESELHLDSPSEAFDVYARALSDDRVNEKTLARLDELASQTGRWEDLAKLFDRELQDVVEVEHAIALGLRDGAIYEEKLGQISEAIARYQRLLEFDPENRAALSRLESLFQMEERWEDLAKVLQQEALIVDDPEKSLELQFRLGQIYQQELHQVDRAVEVYRDILAAEPTHEKTASALELLFTEGVKRSEIAEILEPLYRMQAAWERLVGLYQTQLEELQEIPDRLAMIHRIAELQEEKILDAVEAFNWYCRGFSTDPLDERSGEEIERLAKATGSWGELADLYQGIFSGRKEEEIRRLAAKRLARVAEEELTDVARAEQAYRGCLSLGGDDMEVLGALDRIYTQYMEWERLIPILENLAKIVPADEDKVRYIHRIGTIYETQLDAPDKARECFHRVVDDLDPAHRPSLEHLEAIYAAKEAWSELFDIYSRMRDAASSDAEQADLFAKMAVLSAECLDDVPKAIEYWGNVLDIRGEDGGALEKLAELHARRESWNDLVEVLDRAVLVAADDAARIRIYSQLGTVWGERLGRDRNALENWENVLSIDSRNLDALKAIAKIREANQEWTDLIQVIDRLIDAGAALFDVEELKGYYAKLGTIYATTLEQPMEAIEAWNHAHDVDPADLAPIEALIRLYEAQALWEELIGAYTKKANAVSGQAQIDALLEQAKVFEEKLDAPLRAEDSYARILEIQPIHDYAFQRLVQIKTEKADWGPLVDAYFKRLEYIENLSDRIQIYHAAAAIYERKLGQMESAFVVMQRAFEEDYSNDETAKHLERLASLAGKWEQLLASCNQVLQTVQDRPTQIALCLKIGKWYADELGHPDYAIAYYQQVLQLDPENVSALRLMGELYRMAKQWPELVQVLGRAVECERDDGKRRDLLVELGDVHEAYQKDMPLARKAYKAALEIDAGLEVAINALERILGKAEDWQELIPILRRKLGVIADQPENQIRTILKIAEIYEKNLNDLESGIEEYRKVLELDQGNMQALKGLERLYTKGQRWPDLLDILEMQLDYVTSERERIALYIQIAKMMEREFLKPDKAAERYEQVLDIDPSFEEALLALEKIYWQAGQWDELIGTLDRHISALPERLKKIPLYQQKAQIFATEIKDTDRAVDAFKEILIIDESNEEALDQLALLQSSMEDWNAAHETLKRLAEVVAEPERKVDLYYRLGALNEEHLMNRRLAVEHFQSALDINSGHTPTLGALRKIYVDEGNWVQAARVLEAEQAYTEKPRVKSQLQYELGRLLSDKLDEPGKAVGWYEQALQSNPDNQEAAEPLVDVYIEQQRWDDAAPLLEMLIRLGAKRPQAELLPLYLKSAKVADKTGNLDRALKAYEAAHALDAAYLPTVIGLADTYFRMADWDKAFKFYQIVLVHHREKQGKDEIVEIFYRLGHIKAQVQERRKALNMYDKALEIDPSHKATLGAVIQLHEEQGNFEQVIHYKKLLMDAVGQEEKFAILVEIGDIWHQKLKNPQKAISSYVEALEISANDRPTLHKLLPLYQATKQWKNVVDIIGRIAAMENNNETLGRLYYTMGVVFRDEIKSADDAVNAFNLSLDASLENLKTFEAIDRILTQKKDWKSLERNYRKMLHRITGKGKKEIEINLWHFLGEIYRTRMNQYEPAAEAFKMASQLDPENAMRHEILAELYVMLPNRMEDAIKEYQWLIQKNPYHVESYKALRKLYFDNREYDKAWCLCATLSFLKKADQEEQQFFEQYRTRGMVRAQARLDNERWLKDLIHPEESVYVGKIFEAVTNATRRIKIQPIKAFGLKKTQKRPLNDTMTFSKTFFYAAQVLNLPVIPELYIQDDKPGNLNFAITEPMASACGASLLSGYSPQDLLFIVSKHLSYYRPEHYIRWVLPTHGELKMLLLAAMKIGAPDFQLPADKSGVLEQYVNVLNTKLEPVERETLSKVVRKFVKTGEVVDIKKWIRCVELTACRAGFLLANDLEVAARMIQAESGTVDDIPPKEKIKELVLFSISEQYFQLRKTLGISIGAAT